LRLDDQEVDAALDQPLHLLAIRFKRLLARDGAERRDRILAVKTVSFAIVSPDVYSSLLVK